MATILTILKRFEAVNTDTISADSIEETAPQMMDANRAQMDAGLTREGDEIFPPYAPLTVAIKRLKGQPVDRVTLKDTGDFYRGFSVIVTADQVLTGSTDEKNAKLRAKYGEAIFGLGGQFKAGYVNNALRPVFKQKIETATGLVMR